MWRVLTWRLKGAMRNNEEGFALYVAKGKVEPCSEFEGKLFGETRFWRTHLGILM
jgi:hypothetical protein